MNKRYQVFISSTFEDLKEERKEIIETLLNAKYLPSGMEMFSASNEEQFKYIKKIIDDCDYYVLVLGARYGSINEKSGKSFTEMEYDYALEKGIPILSFVHNNPENLPAHKRETDNVELFRNFRKRVLENSKMCKMWSGKSDLVANVVVSLVQIVDECPSIGWSRGVQDTMELLTQINDLRIENENLKIQNKDLQLNRSSNQIDKKYLSQGNDKFSITGKTFEEITQVYNDAYGDFVDVWSKASDLELVLTWNNILEFVAPEIYVHDFESSFENAINKCCEDLFGLKHFEISKRSYNQIKFQMIALEWIEIEANFLDGNSVILSDEGRKAFMDIVTIKREI